MDTALSAAIARMAEIEEQISSQKNAINDANARLTRLEGERANVARWIEMWHQLAGTQGHPVAAERNMISLPVENTGKRSRPKNPDREVVANASLEIIRACGAPVSRRDLFEKLTKRGISISGKDPEMVLSTMLWRSRDRIVRLPGSGYWPADVPFDTTKYSPEADVLARSASGEPEEVN